MEPVYFPATLPPTTALTLMDDWFRELTPELTLNAPIPLKPLVVKLLFPV